MMKFLVIYALFASSSFAKLFNTNDAFLSREKRTLLYREGLNWVQVVIGIGLPVEIEKNSITIGTALKSYYALPTNSTTYTSPSIDIERRRKRSLTRWQLYKAIQMFADSFGNNDGKSCLLHAICESSFAPFDGKSGLFGEILHLLLTPSSTREQVESHFDYEYHAAEKLGKEARNCQMLFPCKLNFMTWFTKVFS